MTETANDEPASDDLRDIGDGAGGIVIGVDGSPPSLAALRWGLREASCRQTFAVAAMAYTYLDQHHAAADVFDPAYDEADAAAALETFVDHLDASTYDPRALRRAVGCDLPGRYLVELSESAALLVVGRRGLGHLREALIGSTSHYCLRHADCPLMIVDPTPEGSDEPRPVHRIVVGVDDWHSFAAVRWAVDAARRHGASVELVHVRPPHTPAVGEFMWSDDEPTQTHDAREQMDFMVASLDTSGLTTPVIRSVVEGSPAGAIMERAAVADLVVVGAKPARRRHVSPLWVPERLVHRGSWPVVVVPSGSAHTDVEAADR